MQASTRKIVIIGPESTGKSTLARQLAAHFYSTYADEYARIYLERLDRPYCREDFDLMAQGQIVLEEEAMANAQNGVVFFDTDLYVLKVWSEDKYGSCPEKILQEIACRSYDLYLLTDIDLPWEDDPLREHGAPEMRRYFFNIYHDIVQHSGIPFIVVKGDKEQRLQQALVALANL